MSDTFASMNISAEAKDAARKLLEDGDIYWDDDVYCYRINVENAIAKLSQPHVYPHTGTLRREVYLEAPDSNSGTLIPEHVTCACALGSITLRDYIGPTPRYFEIISCLFPLPYQTGVTTGFDFLPTEARFRASQYVYDGNLDVVKVQIGLEDGMAVRKGVRHTGRLIDHTKFESIPLFFSERRNRKVVNVTF